MSDALVRVKNELGHEYTTKIVAEGETRLRKAAVDGMGNPLPTIYPEAEQTSDPGAGDNADKD